MDILFKFDTPPEKTPLIAVPGLYSVLPKDNYFLNRVYIFDLPIENGVGSLSVDYSSLTAIEFKNDDELHYRRIKRGRDIEIMDQGFTLLPKKKMVGWNQGRGFQLIDINRKKVSYWSICSEMEDNIEALQCLDEEKMIFLFEVRNASRKGFNDPLSLKFQPGDWRVFLKTVDLSDKPVKGISENLIDISDRESFWTVHNKTIYYFSEKAGRLLAFNENLKPIYPPLVDAFNKIASIGAGAAIGTLIFHPNLSFAIISIGVNSDTTNLLPLYYIALLKDNECKFVPLFGGKEEIHFKKFTFSPDGNWLVFSYTADYDAPPHYYYMKVNPKNPMFLEPPKYLGNIFAKKRVQPLTTAWSTKPLSFVVCDGKVIYRWNMEKVAAGRRQDQH
jgi:hypothetical protein